MGDQLSQTIIDKLFEDNPNLLVNHHLESFNEFYRDGIKRIFREKNPIRIMKDQNENGNFNLRCNIFLAGKNGDKLYYGKPIIYDDGREHFMYPNEARLRNMTYGITIHYDVDLEFYIKDKDGEYPSEPTYNSTLEKIFLGRFPIMMYSDLCILKDMAPDVRFEMGECRNDYGGYFIVDGKEKVIVSQEKFADNMLYVRDKVNDLYSHAADIRSVSEDASKPIRTLSVRMVAPSEKYTNNQIVVNLPNVRKPVPLFIVMRALGVLSDKSIIEHCLLDIEKYSSYIDLFIPCVHDAGMIFSQEQALKYIATFTKHKTSAHALEILTNYFLPHIGEMNFKSKAYYLGHMVKELLRVYTKDTKPTDRDSFRFKRVELPGNLLYDLFKEYLNIQQKDIYQKIDKEYTFKKGIYKHNFIGLIEQNYREHFGERRIEQGFRKAYKGNWGADEGTKRMGVVQTLNRLSFNAAISHLRKINLPLDASAKVIGPRLLHGSQWGIIDPVDTPDGGNVGLHKHMAMGAAITTNCSGKPIIRWLRENGTRLLEEGTPSFNAQLTKVMVNGAWIGVNARPQDVCSKLKAFRRSGLIPMYTSVQWDIAGQCIFIYTDAGRMCRPIFYVDDNNRASFDKKEIKDTLESGKYSWKQLVSGFAPKKDPNFNNKGCQIYKLNELYDAPDIDSLTSSQAIIDYLDTAEEEGALIAFMEDDLSKKSYTNIEIHPSLILGVMGNQVVFPENNQLPRDLFACGQMRQAVSLYHSNYQTRIDKMGVVLNYGQTPLVKSRYLDKICKEQHPYGENVVAAIMCYGGYNVEDSILFNEGAIKRGLFRTTYYNSYESKEESSKVGMSQVDSQFANIETANVTGLRNGFDYSHLDKHGLIKENTPLDEKKVIIGKITNNLQDPGVSSDDSVVPKKGQLGFVDKAFITEGEEGFRIAKVRVRDERVPAIGDKFCSRCGQKGTIGLVIPEENMPFTKEGIRPDIIINPHALPSRMTIGQLVETLMGKACAMYGGFGDCTAFMNKGQKATSFGKMLTNVGFNSSGNQMLLNGETGEQMYSEIFIGPTYYMRLKHMVKDKINYRSKGPRTLLTRQTVQGRANDGGLRVGEMERDGIAAHGATAFLQESMLVRGDQYYMAVCNKTGMTAIYNESYNLFLSPIADGPIKFVGTLNDGLNIENISKHGRSFSIIRIPYAFKLLMQELQGMNIQLRIITEDNIDQLSSMAFSDNIVRLIGKEGVTATDVAKNAKSKFRPRPEIMNSTPKPNPYVPDSPLDSPESPNYPPPGIADEYGQLKGGPMFEDEPTTPKIHLDMDVSKKDPLAWGWMFDTSSYESGDIYRSLIIEDTGKSSQKWWVDDNDYQVPREHPIDWNNGDLVKKDGSIIQDNIIIGALLADQQPGNWKRVIEKFNPGVYPEAAQATPDYNPISPNYNPNSPEYNPNSPEYAPQSPDYNPNSPAYAPQSPDYNPNSPAYAPQTIGSKPNSPAYAPQTPEYGPPSSSELKGGAQPVNVNIYMPGKSDDETKEKTIQEVAADEIQGSITEAKNTIVIDTEPANSNVSDGILKFNDDSGSSNGDDNNEETGGGDKKKVTIRS
uniref:DNA-directed RNA polymerase n=1 Tax=viral metagenome TaxID=1070528 RepID=A0A6C0LJ02_9ZZZZ